MVLNNISIFNYKNLREVELAFSPGINCFVGKNGEGKTNLLDAIYYLSFCRSSSNPIDSQLPFHGEEFFSLEGKYTLDDGSSSTDLRLRLGKVNSPLALHKGSTEVVSCGFRKGHRKIVKLGGKAYKRLSEHIGRIPLILVTPEDSLLVEAGSEERRRFMDIVISQYDPMYLEALSAYNKALSQRNALLRSEGGFDVALMDILENEMALEGEVVYEKRNTFITEFVPYFQRIYEAISSGREAIQVNYISHAQRGSLRKVIEEGRNKDVAVGYSLHGIHRDDLELLLDGYNIRREGSQGQNKTLVLSMKLAQFEFLRRTVSLSTPLLLLDDIFDKLDAIRVENIIALVASESYGQIFITDTNRAHIDNILSSSKSDYSLFHVEKGKVNRI